MFNTFMVTIGYFILFTLSSSKAGYGFGYQHGPAPEHFFSRALDKVKTKRKHAELEKKAASAKGLN